MDGEIWRTVPSVPRLLVSSEGRVMYLPYRKPVLNGAGERSYGGQPTFGVWNKQDGRFIIVVNSSSDGGRRRGQTYKIHRLVAEAFHGPAPFEGAVVMHNDENAANNRASNLRWGTQKENLNADGFLDYCRTRTGENSPSIKGRKRNGGRQNRGSLLTAFGKSQTLVEWARESGILLGTLHARLKAGWGIDDALSRPLGKQSMGVRAYQSNRRTRRCDLQ
jgi:HNH endonuclease